MRILIATDAWAPQINGVVTALSNTRLQRQFPEARYAEGFPWARSAQRFLECQVPAAAGAARAA